MCSHCSVYMPVCSHLRHQRFYFQAVVSCAIASFLSFLTLYSAILHPCRLKRCNLLPSFFQPVGLTQTAEAHGGRWGGGSVRGQNRGGIAAFIFVCLSGVSDRHCSQAGQLKGVRAEREEEGMSKRMKTR